jgi:MOSC domain-containing protein YiiM
VQSVAVPAPGPPPLSRSVAACLASILEADVADVPVPPEEHPEPWTVWRGWLATRGMGLVPVLDPRTFGWPGPWLALLRREPGAGQVAAVAFGSPPGLAWSPLGGPEGFDAVEAGYVVAPADAALWAPVPAETTRATGRVEALAIAGAAEAPMMTVREATAQAGRGLVGDRYFCARGTFSNPHARGHDLTLIEAEALAMAAVPSLLAAPEAARRNVVTRGIDLDALVGRRFTVGDVECAGRRLCEPCAHLERLTERGALRALVHRGGLRADVLTGGVIRVGDPVVAA